MIETADHGGCLTLTINRQDKANALTEAMLAEMADHICRATAKVLVLTGRGRVFSAGADLDEVKGGALATSSEWERLSAAVAGFQGLSLAALNGTAAGGALGMVLACDLRIAVPSAVFFYPVMKMGVLPQPSDPKRLRALIGPSQATRILLAGVRITSAEALAIGLIDEICAPEDLNARLAELTLPALQGDGDRLLAIKAMISAR